MPSIDDLIVTIEVELEQARKVRDKALSEIKFTLDKVSKEGRAGLSTEERERVEELFERGDKAKVDVAEIEAKLDSAKRAKAEEVELEKLNEERTSTGIKPPAYDRVARVGREERTYRPDTDRAGGMFLRDVAMSFLQQNPESTYRLNHHMQEERIERSAYLQRAAGDATTGAFTGLVVPQYLTDMYAPATANLRPFADICNKHPLPASGMQVNISRITTASSAALQSTELTAVSATSIDDTILQPAVQTAAGQQTLSRQAIERGTGIEDVVMSDLFRRYATVLDSTLINQATNGLAAVATAITYTDATPTAAELYPKLHAAAAGVEAALLGFAVPSHVVMHSRRWYWLQSQVGTSWPFIQQPGVDTQAGGVNAATAYASGFRGLLPNGMIAIVDNNIVTNSGAGTEDIMYVVPNDECHLWEDSNAPVFIRAEQPALANLGVLMVLYGYFAYTFGRYANAIQSITGTGLIAPVF